MKKTKAMIEAMRAIDKALADYAVSDALQATAAVAGALAAKSTRGDVKRYAGLGATIEAVVEAFATTIVHEREQRPAAAQPNVKEEGMGDWPPQEDRYFIDRMRWLCGARLSGAVLDEVWAGLPRLVELAQRAESQRERDAMIAESQEWGTGLYWGQQIAAAIRATASPQHDEHQT